VALKVMLKERREKASNRRRIAVRYGTQSLQHLG
jgi:hypothetical protein